MYAFLITYYYCNLNAIYDLLITSTPSKEQLHWRKGSQYIQLQTLGCRTCLDYTASKGALPSGATEDRAVVACPCENPFPDRTVETSRGLTFARK
jgi:hypothetical protein